MSVRVWKIEREQILARLKRWATELSQDKNVLGVVVFGSLARGDHTAASDADILILLHDSPLRFDERIPLLLPKGIGIGVDVFPYTLKEAQQARREGWGVVNIALREGILMFERKSIFEGFHKTLIRKGFAKRGNRE